MTTHEMLDHLLTSPGWALLCAYADREWGAETLLARIEQAPAEVALILAEQRAIRRLLTWPSRERQTHEAGA